MSKIEIRDPQLIPISLSDAAVKHIKGEMKRKLASAFRLSISTAGCSGLRYEPEVISDINPEDFCFENHKAFKVYVDKNAYPYVKGTNIDFEQQGLNWVFVYDNPNESGSCGCGESFTVNKDEQGE